MSTFAKRALVSFLIVIGLAVLGFAGFYFGKKAPAPVNQPIPPSQTLVQTEPPRAPRMIDTPYHITQPTMGMLQQTVAVDVTVDEARAIAAAHARVQTGMDVILYDAQDFALPDKGRVAQSDEDGIIIDLPDYLSVPARAEIIIDHIDHARRLPISAQRGNIVWKATPFPDGSVVLSRIDLPADYFHNDTHFQIDAGLRADEYAVVSPSDDFREGDILINVYPVEFDAPVLDQAAMARGRIEELRMAALLYAIENAPQSTSNPDGSATCAVPEAGPGEAAATPCGTCTLQTP